VDISLGAMQYGKQNDHPGRRSRAGPRIQAADPGLHGGRSCRAQSVRESAARLGDVESMLLVQKQRLDWRYINQALEDLCGLTENVEIPGKLHQLRKSLGL
jgi:hypothetical protein